MFSLQIWNGKETKFNKVKKQIKDKIEKKTLTSKTFGYMRQNILTTGKVQSQMMLMIEQHLNYNTQETQNIETIFERSFFNYFC